MSIRDANGKLAITPGVWVCIENDCIENAACDHVANTIWSDHCEANAWLIAEAGTVTNECGKTPRELLDLCRELRAALEKLHRKCRTSQRPDHAEWVASTNALAKAEGI